MKEKNLITAERIKQCRLSADETLEQVGKLIGVHKTTVRRWETGETDRIALSTIQKLALHYNVNPAWLMGADVSKEQYEKTIDLISPNLSSLTKHEKSVITAYRGKPEMQPAVDKLLGVEEEYINEKRA